MSRGPNQPSDEIKDTVLATPVGSPTGPDGPPHIPAHTVLNPAPLIVGMGWVRVLDVATVLLAGFAILYFAIRFVFADDPPALAKAMDMHRGEGSFDDDLSWFNSPRIPMARAFIEAMILFGLTAVISLRRREPMALLVSSMLRMVGIISVVVLTVASFDNEIARTASAIIYGGIVMLGFFTLVVFPDGRPFPRWGLWVVPLLAMPIIWVAAEILIIREFSPGIITIGMFNTIVVLVFQVRRYRRSNLTQRMQIKWLGYAVVVGLGTQMIALSLFQVSLNATGPTAAFLRVLHEFSLLTSYTLVALALLAGAARYRVWRIDQLIHKSVVGAIATGLLGVGFVVVFLLLRGLLDSALEGATTISVAITTAIVLASFRWTLAHVRRFIDRRFYGIGIDYQAIADRAHELMTLEDEAPTAKSMGYQDIETLGRGGMGAVYKARHPETASPVALKIMSAKAAEMPEMRQRFVLEAQLLSEFDHPNIVSFIDSGDAGGIPFLAMDLIHGQNLGDALRYRTTPPTLEEILPVLRDTAVAIDAIHAAGVVHRDLKPGNIMLEGDPSLPLEDRRGLLVDFGVARRTGGTDGGTKLTHPGSLVGTLEYISPEQADNPATVGGSADLYSFGIIVYEVVVGHPPFQDTSPLGLVLAHMRRPPPDPRETLPTLGAAVCDVVLKGIAKLPEERYATATAYVEALADASAK